MASKCRSRSRGPSASGYGPRVDITERFAAVVQQPDDEIALDEAAFLIAAHDHPVDVDSGLRDLDALAAEIGAVDAPALAHALFVTRGFAGNTVDYGDPRNSYLDVVLDRHLGLPITLSVLMIEVGRRLGLELRGVGMPGHFLVGVATNGSFIDPFHQGASLTTDDARALYERTHPGAAFADAYLDPVGPRVVLARMLANLVHSFGTRAPLAAVWALKLRLAIPDLPAHEREDGEQLLARLKAYSN
jgi:regulator of sirC expression with transglutaminase-like and TPR domain